MAPRGIEILPFLEDADALCQRLVLAEVLGPRAPRPPLLPPGPIRPVDLGQSQGQGQQRRRREEER